MKLCDYGWIWEGQGLDPGVPTSIFGVGEGAKYFGLEKVVYLFHPNNELAMKKLSGMKEIVCGISYDYYNTLYTSALDAPPGRDKNPNNFNYGPEYVNKPGLVNSETENLCNLSNKFPNITGAMYDDILITVKRDGRGLEDLILINKALHNRNLKLWAVLYQHEIEQDIKKRHEALTLQYQELLPYLDFVDIINLWIDNPKDIVDIDMYVNRCRELFPGKPINLGCNMRDYWSASPIPMDILRYQWEKIPRYIENNMIQAYSILGTVLIDGHQEQAEWIRNFIAAN